MAKGIFILVLITFLVMGGLNRTAYLTGAGDTAYSFSLLFVIAQGAAAIYCYCAWYCKVNHLAADLYNTEEMRKAASSKILRFLLRYLLLNLFIGIVALALILLSAIFAGISQLYCFSSIISEALAGFITLLLLMYVFGLPNRVLGRY